MFQGDGGRSKRELSKGVWGAGRKPGHPSLLMWESKLPSLFSLAVLGSWEPGFPLQRGITEALAYLLLSLHSFSFLGPTYESFGNTVVLF